MRRQFAIIGMSTFISLTLSLASYGQADSGYYYGTGQEMTGTPAQTVSQNTVYPPINPMDAGFQQVAYFADETVQQPTQQQIQQSRQPLPLGQATPEMNGLTNQQQNIFMPDPYTGGFANSCETGCETCGDSSCGGSCGDSVCGNGFCMEGEGLLPCHVKRFGRFFFDGWANAGVTSNPGWPLYTSAGTPGLYGSNSEPQDMSLNQLYLTFGRQTLKNWGAWSVGGQIDLLYGSDYMYASSVGLETESYTKFGTPAQTVYAAQPKWNRNSRGGYPEYGLAMPQAYGELYAPIGGYGMTIKGGHFYSPMGYEYVQSPNNFFYSHSYSMIYGEPQTLTGVMAEMQLNQWWTVLGGVSQGWNTWEDPNDELSYFGGLRIDSLNKQTSLAFTAMSGEEMVDQSGRRTNYSLVFQHKITPALQYVLQHDLGFEENGSTYYDVNGRQQREDAHWYSVTNYMYYQLTQTLAIGGRFEWFKDENQSRILAIPTRYERFGMRIDGDNYYEATLGLNWKPTNWFTLRPEVRYDWSDVKMVDAGGQEWGGVYDDFSEDDLITVGADMIIRF